MFICCALVMSWRDSVGVLFRKCWAGYNHKDSKYFSETFVECKLYRKSFLQLLYLSKDMCYFCSSVLICLIYLWCRFCVAKIYILAFCSCPFDRKKCYCWDVDVGVWFSEANSTSGQVSAWQSIISCKSVQPVPACVEELLEVVLRTTMHPFPRCLKPARESKLSKLILQVRISPQAENTIYNKHHIISKCSWTMLAPPAVAAFCIFSHFFLREKTRIAIKGVFVLMRLEFERFLTASSVVPRSLQVNILIYCSCCSGFII